MGQCRLLLMLEVACIRCGIRCGMCNRCIIHSVYVFGAVFIECAIGVTCIRCWMFPHVACFLRGMYSLFTLFSVALRCETFSVWHVLLVACSPCSMFSVWRVFGVSCFRCGMFPVSHVLGVVFHSAVCFQYDMFSVQHADCVLCI